MNDVPFHAIRLHGKPLIDHCRTLSYGQTLGLFLENHAGEVQEGGLPLRVVVGKDVPLYDLLMPRVRELYGEEVREERPTAWTELSASLAASPAYDTLFACHGQYVPDDLDASYLQLAGGGAAARVDFSRVFAELDLRGCRSVFMGACESGLARVGVGAEYVGLPSAMLASGVRNVVGALYPIPQLATAVLVGRYLELTKDRTANVCAALSTAQREVKGMSRAQAAEWCKKVMASHPDLQAVLAEVGKLDEHPFAHPYHWAGLQVVGDV